MDSKVSHGGGPNQPYIRLPEMTNGWVVSYSGLVALRTAQTALRRASRAQAPGACENGLERPCFPEQKR